MAQFTPMRNLPSDAGYKKGDVMVIFGEIFSKGYVNGIIDAGKKLGMTVVQTTVGRRENDGTLRPLNSEELADKEQPFINIPLEAGFDVEPADNGVSPCDQLAGVKMKEWQSAQLDWELVEQSRTRALKRFKANVEAYMQELEKHIPDGANVLFVHTMAGGVPRAKILMPTMNRIVKGRGERFQPSQPFWESPMGQLCDKNFNEVTADTFKYLVEQSEPIRQRIESAGNRVAYVAYGYHGTEVLIDGEYRWQSYSPYIQGWAKRRLENHAIDFQKQGIPCAVYNCPEILTNSSSIFLGVEICLYPLMAAYRKESGKTDAVEKKIGAHRSLLKDEHTLDALLEKCNEFISNPAITNSYDFETWPQHNTLEQMDALLEGSSQLMDMHKDKKDLITFPLSEDVFMATGALMLNDSWQAKEPVWWLGHDIVAKQIDVWL